MLCVRRQYRAHRRQDRNDHRYKGCRAGALSENVVSDLQEPGRNPLAFIHGFDNDFEASITRAAFNCEWFSQSGVRAADTIGVAFSWPSLGRLLDLPLHWTDYRRDQTEAV
jgi:esterase/lipase superfamily enzyme